MEKEGINNQIADRLKTLREIGNIEYAKPDPQKNEEYISRLKKSKEALLYLTRDRKFSLETIKHFRLGLSEKGTISIPIYKNGELIDWKFRTIPPEEKKFYRFPQSETYIFNGDEGLKEGIKKGEILILEGEGDAIATYQAGFKNVISLVGGANSVGHWINELDNIPKIFICLDSDSVGQEAAQNLAERLGVEKSINVKLPVKDANDFFKKYGKKEFQNVLSNSKPFPINDVVHLGDLYDEVKSNKKGIKDFKFGYQNIQDVTGGFNRGNLITLSGPTSSGKSTFALNNAIKFCQNNYPFLYIPIEDSPRYVARRIFNILSGVEVSQLNNDEWDSLKNKVIDLPFYLYVGGSKLDLNVFRNIVEIGKKIYNIEIFLLDHIHFLARRTNDMTQEIGFIVRELVEICRTFNVVIFNIAHVRNKQNSEGGWKELPHMFALKDSSGISQDSHMVIMVFQYQRETSTPILQVAIQKNREGGITKEPLEYDFDVETGIISEQSLIDEAKKIFE